MVEILHISDFHGNQRVMAHLQALAAAERGCEVVACTGDCTSLLGTIPPSSWNNWPQRTKLLVRGNHDLPDTFIALSHWVTKVPWQRTVGDLLFIGIDTAEGFDDALSQMEQLFRAGIPASTQGVVVLSHQWPSELHANQLGAGLQALIGSRPLLFCHGHDHPAEFEGSGWDDRAALGGLICARSHVYSAKTESGLAHRLTWASRKFFYTQVSGRS